MYSPPIKYGDFLQKFPTEADAFQFYQTHCGIYCPSCGDKRFAYLRDGKPYMAYCKKCHKEFSILKDTIFVRKVENTVKLTVGTDEIDPVKTA